MNIEKNYSASIASVLRHIDLRENVVPFCVLITRCIAHIIAYLVEYHI